MSDPERDHQAQLQQTLDRLGATEQQLLDHHRLIDRAMTPFDRVESTVSTRRPRRSPIGRPARVNIDLLDSRLSAQFGTQYGYTYLIRRNGAVVIKRSNLDARRGATVQIGGVQVVDPGLRWSEQVPMNIGSVTKFITAIAIDMLLRDNVLGIELKPAEESVFKHLPDYWFLPPYVEDITFHHLLRHESGLGGRLDPPAPAARVSGAGDITTARVEIANNHVGVGPAVFNYKNMNYAILRVTFATLTGAAPAWLLSPDPQLISDDDVWDFASARAYQDFVNTRIFEPAGIAPRDFIATDDAAWAYSTPPTAPGARMPDGFTVAGTTGWHLSVEEVTKLARRFRTGAIMSEIFAERLLNNGYGLDSIDNTGAGLVYRKNGRYTDNADNVMDAGLYMLPNDIELAIFVNSGIPTPLGGTPSNPASYLDQVPAIIAACVEPVI